MSNAARIRLHTRKTCHRISPYVRGHFIERLGGCICDGIWVGEEFDIPNDAGIRLDAPFVLPAHSLTTLEIAVTR
jgi:alpha-L-arabinofuranosidase